MIIIDGAVLKDYFSKDFAMDLLFSCFASKYLAG